jgi:hypothetical protein
MLFVIVAQVEWGHTFQAAVEYCTIDEVKSGIREYVLYKYGKVRQATLRTL